MSKPLTSDLRGRLLRDAMLTDYTSWRVGGRADCLYIPQDLTDLSAFLAQLPAIEPLTWLGLGSNVLVRDGGIRGTVIVTHTGLKELTCLAPDVIRAEAGVSCAKVARFTAREGLEGAEFLAGIPGTMGGALAMNAGACGGETWRLVCAVETIDRAGVCRQRAPQEYHVQYRYVQPPAQEWFVAAHLRLSPGDVLVAKQRIRDCLDQRHATQPTHLPSCGSVFKNPPNTYAGLLIESCGLKGFCVGDAAVSTKHANFIVNTGKASATDIEHLIALVVAKVQQECGVSLQTEVKIIGERE